MGSLGWSDHIWNIGFSSKNYTLKDSDKLECLENNGGGGPLSPLPHSSSLPVTEPKLDKLYRNLVTSYAQCSAD